MGILLWENIKQCGPVQNGFQSYFLFNSSTNQSVLFISYGIQQYCGIKHFKCARIWVGCAFLALQVNIKSNAESKKMPLQENTAVKSCGLPLKSDHWSDEVFWTRSFPLLCRLAGASFCIVKALKVKGSF